MDQARAEGQRGRQVAGLPRTATFVADLPGQGEGVVDAPDVGKRGRGAAATLIGVGVASFVVAGLVAAGPAAATKGGSSGAPPGNNATIKINNVPVDNVNNDPHVTCPFRLSFYNFDAGTNVSNAAVVTYVAQPPSGKNVVLPPSVGDSSFTFPGPNTFEDYSFDPVATLGQLVKQPQQGYHVKVTVKVTSTVPKGKSGKTGTKVTTKHKVFWLTCDPSPTPTPTPTPTITPTITPSPTTSVLGEKVTRKPPTTHVKAVKVTRLPFTGISSRTTAVAGFAMAGFVLTGSGLVLLGRRPKPQPVR